MRRLAGDAIEMRIISPPLSVKFFSPCVDTWRPQLSVHLCIDLHVHIPPRPRTLPETGKSVAAVHKTGFTTSGWKSVGGWAPPAHCNLNSTLLHIISIQRWGSEPELLVLMTAKSMLNRALNTRKEKQKCVQEEVKVFAILPAGLDGGNRRSFVFQENIGI